MSQKDRIKTLEAFFTRLHFHRTVTLDTKKEAAMLQLADDWVVNVATANRTAQPEKAINKAYETLKELP